MIVTDRIVHAAVHSQKRAIRFRRVDSDDEDEGNTWPLEESELSREL